ncbi:metalloproteinase inhibitor 3-like [Ylistrum balloti]|uniref:metalloproteinase inhibitor 3-like n=1 Tax=Ylistrum balloti TaxID=509963 RepID=UPI00290588CC|nr:metalloproteinase inhibitor 3-like [Ylistrum balloti]
MTFVSALVFVAFGLCVVYTVFGCSCIPYPMHRQKLYCENDIVFIGKIKKVFPPASMGDDLVYRVRVKRIFKGSCKDVIMVNTPASDSLCGITNLVKGEQYLITAKGNKGTYRISLCQSLILKKDSVTNKVKRMYNSKRPKSFPGLDERNCNCTIKYCGETKEECGTVLPKTCVYYGGNSNIQCYNKLRCIPSSSGNSCRWSAFNCGGPGGIITSG